MKNIFYAHHLLKKYFRSQKIDAKTDLFAKLALTFKKVFSSIGPSGQEDAKANFKFGHFLEGRPAEKKKKCC
jgi:hypothetical protein